MGDTKYARQIKVVTGPSGESIERIFVKGYQQEEIRFSYWPNGGFVPRALDVTEDELTALLGQAFTQGIFSQEFMKDIQTMLNGLLGDEI